MYLLKAYDLYEIDIEPSSATMFYALWGIANGPVGIGTFCIQYSLLLHNLEEMVGTFIHVNPALITWAMRWYSDRYLQTWPKVFNLPTKGQDI